jgi:hypothetical protein
VIDLNRLLQRLCDADIDFVIVDGFAATLHGSSLVTRDLDVCATLSSETSTLPGRKKRRHTFEIRGSGQDLNRITNSQPASVTRINQCVANANRGLSVYPF